MTKIRNSDTVKMRTRLFSRQNAKVVRLGLLWVLFFIVDWFSEVPLRTLLKLTFQTEYFDCFKYGKYG